MTDSEIAQWIHTTVIVLGFLGTGWYGSFKLGRAVEAMRSDIKKYVEEERDKILGEIRKVEQKFEDEQRAQDHSFGEVGTAIRQYITDVDKKLREVEIYGRDNYVKIPDFKDAVEVLRTELKSGFADLKNDFRSLQKADLH